jgi:hypothetical protein
MGWYGCALRMDKMNIPKDVLDMKVRGKFPSGRLRSR